MFTNIARRGVLEIKSLISQIGCPATYEKNSSPRSVNLTFTSHPTNINFEYVDGKGKPRRPFLWEEVKHYYQKIPMLGKTINSSEVKKLQTWIGYDNDRHQDERKNIFTHACLQNKRGCMIANGAFESHPVIKKIDEISLALEESFYENKTIDPTPDLLSLKQLINQSPIAQTHPLIPVSGLMGHYRISSDDLKSEKGLEKIKERIQELSMLRDIFGETPVSEAIIADCTNLQEIKTLNNLLNNGGLKDVAVVPLIEEMLPQEVLRDIVKNSTSKIMLAGSDSMQRETPFGALLMKISIQKVLYEENLNKLDKEKIAFFEGIGSHPSRNGCIPHSRMKTILEVTEYDRTIQGQELESFMTNKKFSNQITHAVARAQGCSMQQLREAEPLIQEIYDILSMEQKALQGEPYFTSRFHIDMVREFVNNNSQNGSRAKLMGETIKGERAITQSMLWNQMRFHPDMMCWHGAEAKEIMEKITAKLDNPLIQAMVDQLTLTWQACDPEEAANWIKDPDFLHEFRLSYDAVGQFLKGLQEIPGLPADMVLHNLNDHGPRFNSQHETWVEAKKELKENKTGKLSSSSAVRSLLQNVGSGYGTSKADHLY